jgi:AraC-like DNA-binding protein
MDIETHVTAGVRWEVHRYAPGPAAALAAHVHECYQIGYSPNFPGQYDYRGERHPVPVGSVHVIHPGEVHAPSDPLDREATAVFPTAFVPVGKMTAAARETQAPVELPFFPPVIEDPALAASFLKWCAAGTDPSAGPLRRDALELSFLTLLVRRYGGGREGTAGREPRAVRQIRDYLHAHVAEPVSLDDLSVLVDLTPAHLNRVFRKAVGLPPYRYLQRLRIERAAWRLAGGAPIAETAYDTGFADQSHLTRQFKQVVGVTPGRYRG